MCGFAALEISNVVNLEVTLQQVGDQEPKGSSLV